MGLGAITRLKEILGLETEPVAVFLLPSGAVSTVFGSFTEVTGHRYCQLLMRARHGESLRLMPDGIEEIMKKSGFLKYRHINTTDFGITKGKTPVTEEKIDEIVAAIAK